MKGKAQKQSTYEGVMIWAVNRYTRVYRLTTRSSVSKYLLVWRTTDSGPPLEHE